MKHLFLVVSIVFIFGCSQVQNQPKETHQTTIIKKEKVFPKLVSNRYNVAFLIMDGTYNTELTAPYDIFQHTQYRKNIKQMNVFTVANTDEAITTFEGLKIIPDYNYTLDSLPKIDILVVPSAEHHLNTDLNDKAMIKFVQQIDKTAEFITSHCDGAFVLAGYSMDTDPHSGHIDPSVAFGLKKIC
uniref:DJ-1/PfpI family protein n=1 Tax=Aquimarina sp. I32.4 TaxID=2053903 RepID=UPI0018EC3D36